jgi:serine/threonine-protein kinase
VPAFADVDSELALGTVVGSDPGPGSAVAERSTVTLKISRYNMRVVPNVSDGKFSKDEAIGALKSAGFNNINPVGETPTADPKLDGKVFSQNPDADTKQLTTTAITIAVYRYISPTTTPPTTTTPPPGN